MVQHLREDFDFYVITRDRDVGDTQPYAGVAPNHWHRVGAAMVLYCSAPRLREVRRAVREVGPDAIYLNSFYESFTQRMIHLRRFGLVPRLPVLIAPRGEFALQAMRIKSWRKAIFRVFAKTLRLYNGMMWQASSEHEVADLLRAKAAPDFHPGLVRQIEEFGEAPAESYPAIAKQAGELKLAFVARISPMKNVEHLFRCVARLRGDIALNLYGPVAEADRAYWTVAQKLLAEVPPNVVVRHHGAVDHAEVRGILQEHHFMVLPTRGENFCHSAVEAFSAGVPVILSDATPWRNLEAQEAGFDVPLDQPETWVSVLQRCVEMSPLEYEKFREGARRYRLHIGEDALAAKHRDLFQQLISSSRIGSNQL
jgi:glycosyltransferase involved in cell wall biosynthesis